LQFPPCFGNIVFVSVRIAIVKQQTPTQRMLKAFFARDLAVSGQRSAVSIHIF